MKQNRRTLIAAQNPRFKPCTPAMTTAKRQVEHGRELFCLL
jgi:hypothetical protein